MLLETSSIDAAVRLLVYGFGLAGILHLVLRRLGWRRPVPVHAIRVIPEAMATAMALLQVTVVGVIDSGPLVDPVLEGMDAAIGVHWSEVSATLLASPWIRHALEGIYPSATFVVPLMVMGWFLAGDARRADVIATGFLLASTIAIAIWLCLPSLGPMAKAAAEGMPEGETFASLAATIARHVALQSGDTHLIGELPQLGLVAFPSIHTVMAVCTVYGTWDVRVFRWSGFAFAVATVVSAVPLGGHHVVDLVGGAAVAWIGLRLAEAIADLAYTSPTHARAMARPTRSAAAPCADTSAA